MKLRINENDEIVVEPKGYEEEDKLREIAEEGYRIDVVRVKSKHRWNDPSQVQYLTS